MKMRKVLDLEKNPLIITYNNKSFPLGIIQSLGDKVLPWIYNKYINCVYFPNQERQFDLCMEDWWFTREKLFLIQLIRLSPSYLNFNSINVFSILEECIDKGIYIYGFCNEKYIPNKYLYMKEDVIHEYLIYGYDSEKREFISIGYTNTERYEEYVISYDDYIRSIECMDVFDIYLIQLNKKFDFSFDLDYIIKDLSEYSTNTREENKKKLYGLNCWKKFIENMNNDIENKEKIDIRHTRLFMEHKKLMLKRFEYMSKEGYICSSFKYREIYEEAKLAYALSLKYKMTKRESVAKRIVQMYHNILIKEENVLCEILKEIREVQFAR